MNHVSQKGSVHHHTHKNGKQISRDKDGCTLYEDGVIKLIYEHCEDCKEPDCTAYWDSESKSWRVSR